MSSSSDDIAAIVLAAGESQRFGSENKLMASIDGTMMVEKVMNSIVASGFNKRILVSSIANSALEDIASGNRFEVVINRRANSGMGSSIACGVDAIPENCASGFAIFLGDMPFVKPATIQFIIQSYLEPGTSKIVRPVFAGKPGHPVLFNVCFRNSLKMLDGDKGAASIIKSHRSVLRLIDVDDPGVVQDIDFKNDIPTADSP